MTDYGVTSTGFKVKRLADILADLKTKMETVIDPVSEESLQIDLEDGSIISQQIGIFAEQISLCWQAAAAAALQFDPLANTGAGQTGTCQINGIIRSAGYPSVIPLTVTGAVGTVVPKGSLVATVDNAYQFETVDYVTIGEGGTAEINANCTVKGPVDTGTGTVISVLTPVSGWTAVTNGETLVVGALDETDAELRERQQKSTAYTARCHIEAIYAAIANVEGVTYCRVYQNDTLVEDARTLPAKSIAAIVLGGVDEDIAEAIFYRVGPGISYYGNLPDNEDKGIEFTDLQGEKYYVNFWRPVEVPIDIEITITQTDSTFPSITYEDDIENAILAYVSGGAGAVGASSNFDRDGFPPGEDVILSQLYTPINSVPGFSVTSLEIAKHGEVVGTANIDIDWNEVATFTAGNITVNLE
jgi:uncharacterized phage protein gp47/JayE